MADTPASVVPGLLKDYAASIEQVQQMEAWLEQMDAYVQLQAMKKHVDEVEQAIKTAMKDNGVEGGIIEAGYMAKLTTRHNKGTTTYDIPAIEAQPWGAGCIVKAVNDKVFRAIVEAMKLEPSTYCTTEPGTTVLAVNITKEEEKPTVADTGV